MSRPEPAAPPRAPEPSRDAEPALGASEAAGELERELERVAAAEVTVLLEGESGSGKGLVARRIHARSARAAGPFVQVGLAALTPTLLEAELFGHEEGAFTGAHRRRLGRFRAAQGGTLVLDGVESLPEELQAKLLRVLQEREVEPLGAEAAVPIDVRVIATSSRDLAALVHQGRFREDLYYRLAVVVLRVPPLRARLEDLPALVERITRRVAARARVPARPFGAAALERLAAHSWPGNVRELENAIERVLVLAPPKGAPREVGPEELDFLAEERATETTELARQALALGLSIDELNQALIEEALREERGNVAAAARRVGLTRRALEYRRRQAQADDADGAEPEAAP